MLMPARSLEREGVRVNVDNAGKAAREGRRINVVIPASWPIGGLYPLPVHCWRTVVPC